LPALAFRFAAPACCSKEDVEDLGSKAQDFCGPLESPKKGRLPYLPTKLHRLKTTLEHI